MRHEAHLRLDLVNLDVQPELPRRPRLDPRIVEQPIMQRHDPFHPVPVPRLRRDAKPAVRLRRRDVRMHEP